MFFPGECVYESPEWKLKRLKPYSAVYDTMRSSYKETTSHRVHCSKSWEKRDFSVMSNDSYHRSTSDVFLNNLLYAID